MRFRLSSSAILLAALTAPLSAQSPFKAGENYIGPSISLSPYGSALAFEGDFEHAINDKWGWGASVGYFSYGVVHANYSVIPIAGTAAYHFDAKNEKLDPFVGGSIGYFVVNCSVNGVDCGDFTGVRNSGILIGAFGGIRYWTSDKLALTARAGFGLGFLTVGVDFKL